MMAVHLQGQRSGVESFPEQCKTSKQSPDGGFESHHASVGDWVDKECPAAI